MPRPDRPTIIQVRTNLGLVPGVERLGDVLLDGGLAEALGASVRPAVQAPPYSAERTHPSRLLNADALVDVAMRQAEAVGGALDVGEFPIVLGGDDSVIFGSLLALRDRGRYGLVFLDAHTDFYPPAESPTGEASDSELYLTFGSGPGEMGPLVSSRDTAVIGHRDLDEQRDTGDRLRATDALVVSLAEVRASGAAEIARRALAHVGDAEGFLLHVDSDVLDDALMPAVDYRLPDGLSRREFATLAGMLLADPRAAGLDVTIYNPGLDPGGRAGRNLAGCLLDAFEHAARAS